MLPAASELDLDGAGSQSHRSLLLAESLPPGAGAAGAIGRHQAPLQTLSSCCAFACVSTRSCLEKM